MKIITIGKDDVNWRIIFDLPKLEELTLQNPSKQQLLSIEKINHLKRLRITHARPKDIDFISSLENLEEVVFEYVSFFSDLSPLIELKKLKSLHLENLRSVHDFSGLEGLENLRYLYISGTVDWDQPIDDFNFLNGLPNLEILNFGFVRNNSDFPAFLPIINLDKIKRIGIGRATFQTKEYAFLESAFSSKQCGYMDGDSWNLCTEYNGSFEFLGRGAGKISCKNKEAKSRCSEFTQQYEEMKKQSKIIIDRHRTADN